MKQTLFFTFLALLIISLKSFAGDDIGAYRSQLSAAFNAADLVCHEHPVQPGWTDAKVKHAIWESLTKLSSFEKDEKNLMFTAIMKDGVHAGQSIKNELYFEPDGNERLRLVKLHAEIVKAGGVDLMTGEKAGAVELNVDCDPR